MINLREATIEDLGLLASLEKTVSNLKTYSAMVTEEEWKEELAKSKVYIIEKDGVAIGNISYELKGGDHAYLNGFVVIPDFQGQGIGREVLARILEELKNMRRIDLATHPHNAKAIRLYLSFGFIIESWKDNYFGDGEPRIVLSKTK